MKFHRAFLSLLLSGIALSGFAQVSVNTTGNSPDASAMLDVQSTDKGLLIPRMSSAERMAIASPATGLLVFDTGSNSFYFYNGSNWVVLARTKEIIDADGDTRVTVEETSDEDIIRFDANGVEAMHITAAGLVGLGPVLPSERLHVSGNIKSTGTITAGTSLMLDGGLHRLTSSGHFDAFISSGRAFRLEATATTPNVIGGYSGNFVLSPFPGGTIAGGGDVGFENEVAFSFGTIGGGVGNLITGHSSTIAGGRFNEAGADQSTVGGGQNNIAKRVGTVAGGSGNTADNLALGGATVAGGISNSATGGRAFVGGGESNMASHNYSMVPGGLTNQAGGEYSFAAGRRAKVRTPAQVGGGDLDGDQGAFVWADATNADFASTGPNQFLVRAAGGVGINRNNPMHPVHVGTSASNGNGAHLTVGGMWTNASDRNTKQCIEPVDPQEVLEKLAALPVQYWQYIGESDEVRHLGPMAQDFLCSVWIGTHCYAYRNCRC